MSAQEPAESSAPSPMSSRVAGHPHRQPAVSTTAMAVTLLPWGIVLGLAGGFLQEHRLTVGGLALPAAAVLVVATLVTSIRAVSLSVGTRRAGLLLYLGWLTASTALAMPLSGEDIVFVAGPVPIAYLLSGSLSGAVMVAWRLPRRRDLQAEDPIGAAT